MLRDQLTQVNAAIAATVEADRALAPPPDHLDQPRQRRSGHGRRAPRRTSPSLATSSISSFSALVGVPPIDHDSGQFHGQRHIVRGHTSVRCALYIATLSAVRPSRTLHLFYQRLRGNGRPGQGRYCRRYPKARQPASDALVRDQSSERRAKPVVEGRTMPSSSISRSTGRQRRARRSSYSTMPLIISTSAVATTMPANTPTVSDTSRACSM